jgi:hypothetical protein
VPLDEKQAKSAPDAEDEDEDVGEPPPM